MADAFEGFDESVESAVSDLDAAIHVEKGRGCGSGATAADFLLAPRLYQVIRCPFVFDIEKGRRDGDVLTMSDSPQESFKGEVLLLWGITYETRILSLRAGMTEAICVHLRSVPGILYSCPGEPGDTLEKIRLNQFAPAFYQEVSMNTASPANRITLVISGPVTHAILIGKGMQSCPK